MRSAHGKRNESAAMTDHPNNGKPDKKRDRMLGDEWINWEGDKSGSKIREGKRTFLLLSSIALAGFILLVFLIWYLVLPRFELFGKFWAFVLTAALLAMAAFLAVWYTLLFIAVYSGNNYMNVCLRRGRNLFFHLYPFVMKLARLFGISRDRLGHSFIKVSNRLALPRPGEGTILVLLPRCLNKEIKREIRELCEGYPDVLLHTAPGGSEARRVIKDTAPKAIIAAACERDLVSGIQDVAPRIPVIGIPNTRPIGPCKDTTIEMADLLSALEFFHSKV